MPKSDVRIVGRSTHRGAAVRVGQDVMAPLEVAAGGRIRIRTDRAAEVARWFRLRAYKPRRAGALPARKRYRPAPAAPELQLMPGSITLLTGASGSGKSMLLQQTRQKLQIEEPARAWIDLAKVPVPRGLPLVDCFGDLPLRDTLLLLSRVGLGEAWSYLRPPVALSEGQRWRYRLARGLHAATEEIERSQALGRDDCFPVLACDEFAAVLDRITATVVARCLRRAIDAMPRLAAVVATSHDDLELALAAESIVYCDFGRYETSGAREAI